MDPKIIDPKFPNHLQDIIIAKETYVADQFILVALLLDLAQV